MNKPISIGLKILAYSLGTFVALFLLGLVWAGAVVFIAEACESMFGPWETFQIYTIISLVFAGIEAGIFLLMQILWALLNRDFHATWAARSGLLLFVLTAGLPVLMSSNEAMGWTFLFFGPVATSALMLIPAIRRKKDIEPKVRQVSPEAAPSATPDEPST